MPITIEARRDFVENVVKLSLWLARRRMREGEPLEKAITLRTNIYRLSSLWDGNNHPAHGWHDERWDELLKKLAEIFARHDSDPESDALEEEGLNFLRPLLEARLATDVAAWPAPKAGDYGFFNFDLQPKEKPERINLHLVNRFAPRPPFQDPAARAEELSRLTHDVVAKEPQIAWVICHTWLNTFKPFQDLFPPEYAQSASPPSEMGFHYGWWGQFIDRTGGFHRKNGEHLRRTGTFPYACVACHCGIGSLWRHLETKFGIK